MSNYSKATDFASKDSLLTGDPLKLIKGTEIDDEFESLETHFSTKADLLDPTFTGIPKAPTASVTTNTTQLATTAFVQSALTQSNIINTAQIVDSAVTTNKINNEAVTTAKIDDGAVTLAKLASSALSNAYPVGSVYINAAVSTNPATLLGFGTWVRFGEGRVLVGLDSGDSSFNTLGETGGSKNAIVVSHSHSFSGTTSTKSLTGTFKTDDQSWGTGVFSRSTLSENSSTGSECCASVITMNASHNHTFSGTTSSNGSSGTNANLQPYITVYMWKRTA